MPKFVIEETLACWCTWRRIVEAETESEAYDLFNDGEGDLQNEGAPVIGDCLDGYDCGPEIVGVLSDGVTVSD